MVTKPTTITGQRPHFQVGPLRLILSDRMMEYFAALVMIGDAIMLSIPGTVGGTFEAMRHLGLPDSAFIMFFSIFGTVRILALLANGNIPTYGPRARSICALASAPVWALMGMSQISAWMATGHATLALPIYTLLTLADILSASRATFDVGRI